MADADFWTGFFRVGYDYWYVQFKIGGDTYNCKSNFYCYLTSADADVSGAVEAKITKSEMKITPPVSSSCKVSLHKRSATLQAATDAMAAEKG